MATETDELPKTNIQAFERDKARLEALKVHPAQPIREVIQWLLDEYDARGDLPLRRKKPVRS